MPFNPGMLPWRHEELVADLEALELLGRTIRRARIARRLTQAELADRVQLDQTSISLFELGRYPGLRVILFIPIATVLGLEIEELAPREIVVADAVVEALRMAGLEGEGRVCPSCRSVLRTPIRTNPQS